MHRLSPRDLFEQHSKLNGGLFEGGGLINIRKYFNNSISEGRFPNELKIADDGFAGAILVDLSKAYDCLPHALLIAKLAAYGMSKESLRLLLDYLSNIRQRVKINSSLSSCIEISLGVPQGSVPGPIIFNIFLNDLMYHILDSEICNFTDDNIPFVCAETIEVVIIRLEDEIDRMLQWFESNMLMTNPEKSQALLFSNGRKDFILDMRIFTAKSSGIVKLL